MAITITARTVSDKKKTIMLQMEPTLYTQIVDLAKQANYPVASMINLILKESVTQIKIQK